MAKYKTLIDAIKANIKTEKKEVYSIMIERYYDGAVGKEKEKIDSIFYALCGNSIKGLLYDIEE